MPFPAARVVRRVLSRPDGTFFGMIVLTFAAFVVCAAIEFTPPAAPRSPSPRGPVDDADVKPAGILTPIESE